MVQYVFNQFSYVLLVCKLTFKLDTVSKAKECVTILMKFAVYLLHSD